MEFFLSMPETEIIPGYAKLDVDEDELLRGLLGGTEASAERLPQEAENGISDDSVV